jgi:DNA-binding NtrC family response regulator
MSGTYTNTLETEVSSPYQLADIKKTILLIDDDAAFRKIFTAIARCKRLMVDAYESLADVGSISNLGKYDVVVLDYFLPSVNGVEIAEYIDAFFKDTPVVVISGGVPETSAKMRWPGCIRRFVRKSAGLYQIIAEVASLASPYRKEQHPRVFAKAEGN